MKSQFLVYAAILGLLLLIALIVGGGIFLYMKTETEPTLDEVTLCPAEGPSQTTSIILDATDAISDITEVALLKIMTALVERTPRYGRISLFVIGNDGIDREPAFTFCNPGKLEDLNELARLGIIANPEWIRDRWDDYRSRTLDAIRKSLDRSFEAGSSPVLQGIQLVALLLPKVREDLRPERQPRNRIVIFSDMLEHTSDFSVYRSGFDIEAFRQSDAYKKFIMDLNGVVIEIHFVMRTATAGKNLTDYVMTRNFWRTILIDEMNAYDLRPFRLPGAN